MDWPLVIARRLRRAGLTAPGDVGDRLAAYLALLAKWNRKINLTAFDLDKPSDDAIDRLIVEPLTAARHIRTADRLMIDIGSGGGSPALPMKIAAPWLRVVLVESKTRKAAFLREAVRHLGLPDLEVETRRAEELLTDRDLNEAADIVSIRAVRADAALWRTLVGLTRPGARVFWFAAAGSVSVELPAPLRIAERHPLARMTDNQLIVIEKGS